MTQLAQRPALTLPKLSFQTSFQLNLFWHVIAKYGDVIPANPSLMSAVDQKYKLQNAGARVPSVTRLLRKMAYQADDWTIFEAGFRGRTATSIPSPVRPRFANCEAILRKSMQLEEDSFKSTYARETKQLDRFQEYLTAKWEKHGEFVLTEYSKVTNENWIPNQIETYLVTGCLTTGVFRRDYLILPYLRNFDQGFCILLHLLARYLVTNKVVDLLYQHTGPSQDLYLDAIYGLIVNHVLLNITKNWPDFQAPIEPSGGLEYKIFQSLLPYWHDHLNLQNETFDTFLKRRISEDFIPITELPKTD